MCVCWGGGEAIRRTEIADMRLMKALMLTEIFITTLDSSLLLNGRRKSHSVGPSSLTHYLKKELTAYLACDYGGADG